MAYEWGKYINGEVFIEDPIYYKQWKYYFDRET